MKKFFALLVLAVFMVSLVGCGSPTTAKKEAPKDPGGMGPPKMEQKPPMGM